MRRQNKIGWKEETIKTALPRAEDFASKMIAVGIKSHKRPALVELFLDASLVDGHAERAGCPNDPTMVAELESMLADPEFKDFLTKVRPAAVEQYEDMSEGRRRELHAMTISGTAILDRESRS